MSSLCPHYRPRRIAAAVEWCSRCGAYRVAAEWQLPELAEHMPGEDDTCTAQVSLETAAMEWRQAARVQLDRALAAAHTERADRLERVALWLENLP